MDSKTKTAKMRKQITKHLEAGNFDSNSVMKKTGCSRDVFLWVFGKYLKVLQSKYNKEEIERTIIKSEKEDEYFGEPPEDEKYLPPISHKNLRQYESE